MSSNAFPPPMILGGTVAPYTLLKISSAADRTLLQAALNDRCFAISQGGTDIWQLHTASLGPAGVAGEQIEFFMDGEPILLLAGAGGWNPNDCLKSDANGLGIVGAVGVENIAAIGLEATLAGNYGKVVPFLQYGKGSSGPGGFFKTVTANQALTAAYGGSYLSMNLVTSGTVTLPPVATIAAGWDVTIVNGLATTSGAGTLVAINAADTATVLVYGHDIATPLAGKGVINTEATNVKGDRVTIIFDGTNFLEIASGTWTRQA